MFEKVRVVCVVLIVVVFAFLYGCNSQVNRTKIKKSVVRSYGKVVGFVEVNGDNVYIVANYRSRSRIDYFVEGSLKAKVKTLKGKVIEVEGEIERIDWSGTIKVKKIIKIIGNVQKERGVYKGIQPKH